MRSLSIHWLLSVFGFLLFIAESPAALAHSGHAHAEQASLVQGDTPPTGMVPPAASAKAGGQVQGDCECPGGHCACTPECQALCAISAVPVNEAEQPYSAARPTFFAAQAAAVIGHLPAADPDPPRQLA